MHDFLFTLYDKIPTGSGELNCENSRPFTLYSEFVIVCIKFVIILCDYSYTVKLPLSISNLRLFCRIPLVKNNKKVCFFL